jgi:hypothetical protein
MGRDLAIRSDVEAPRNTAGPRTLVVLAVVCVGLALALVAAQPADETADTAAHAAMPEPRAESPFMEYCSHGGGAAYDCGGLLGGPYYPTPAVASAEAWRQYSCATTTRGVYEYYLRDVPSATRAAWPTPLPAPCPG